MTVYRMTMDEFERLEPWLRANGWRLEGEEDTPYPYRATQTSLSAKASKLRERVRGTDDQTTE